MIGNISWEQADIPSVWIGESRSAGPTVTIIGGVHGDEPTGLEVVRSSLDNLTIDCGTVLLIEGNPKAAGNSHFIDTNLNRCFRPLSQEEQAWDPYELSYELKRAQELIPYLDTAEAALDLHDTDSPCQPFIICERNALTTARKIGAPIVSFGWSTVEPGGTDGYMFTKGKEGICYETGHRKYPKRNLERANGAVARFLIAKGLIEGSLPSLESDPRLVQTQSAFIRTSEHFELARNFYNFEKLKTNELVATHGDKTITAAEDQVIIFPAQNPVVGEEAFILGRECLE